MTNDDEKQSIKDRIRKLFAMANDKGASEAEAETAMRLAMGLMAKHGIEQDQLGSEKPKIKRRRMDQASRDYEAKLAWAAATLYGCEFFTSSVGNGKHYPSFVGRDDNIDAAELTMLWLIQQVEAFYKAALPRGLTVADRAVFRRTFKSAASQRVYDRAKALVADPGSLIEIVGSTALVVAGYFERLQAENDDYLSNSGIKLRTRKSVTLKSGSGTQAGLAAGDRVQLHRRVGASS